MSISKKRLALFLPGLYEGGAERIILNLANGMAERGHDVDLVLARAEGPYMSQVPNSVRVVDLKTARVLSSVPALVGYIKRERPVALLSALFTNIFALSARRLAGGPPRVVISEHNTLSSVVGNQSDDVRWQWYPRVAGWCYPWADQIVAVSKGIADDLAKMTTIPRDRIQVIYNPVVTPDLHEKSEQALDHPWFKEGEPPVILAVGRLTAQKAFDVLIRAFSCVRKHRPAHLLILGEGELRETLQALICELGLEQDVKLAGFVQNPYPYMTHAAVLALSSKWEGLPTVLIEALYLGTPIVATDCAKGTREILMDGQYGRIVPVDAPRDLAEAIEASLDNPSVRPPSESWQPYQSDFVVDRYLSLLLGA